MSKKVIVVCTLDTKGVEAKFLRDQIEARGQETVVVDFGLFGEPPLKAEIPREEVAQASGTSIAELVKRNDRAYAMATLTKGVVKIVKDLYARGNLAGIISLGGSSGTTVATAAMRALPVGVPKIMVSTLASGDVRAFVGTKDITMMYPVVDILGLNAISRRILANGAGAICGMVEEKFVAEGKEKPLVAITMWGITTPCVMKAKSLLEERGFEAIVFHATGTGGEAMEELIQEGHIQAVLDVTIGELTAELVGGPLTAGPHRLEAAGKRGIPQVICPGGADAVVFMGMDKVPPEFKGRQLLDHLPAITVMRTNKEENEKLAQLVAEKVNQAVGPTTILIPLKGFSAFDVAGEWGYDPEADRAFVTALKKSVDCGKVEVIELDAYLNEQEFAVRLVRELGRKMASL